MAYTPTEWKSGDVVTSAKLNKIEAGIGAGGVAVVSMDIDADNQTATLSVSYNELMDLLTEHPVIVMNVEIGGTHTVVFLTAYSIEGSVYNAGFKPLSEEDIIWFSAETATDSLVGSLGGQ